MDQLDFNCPRHPIMFFLHIHLSVSRTKIIKKIPTREAVASVLHNFSKSDQKVNIHNQIMSRGSYFVEIVEKHCNCET